MPIHNPVTQCPKPFDPNTLAPYNLEPKAWDGIPIEFTTLVPYQCKQGMKFVKDFNLDIQESECSDNNIFPIPKEEALWLEPTDDGWATCVESEFVKQTAP